MISALPNKAFYQMSLSWWKICFQNTREAAKDGLSAGVRISGCMVCLDSWQLGGCSLTPEGPGAGSSPGRVKVWGCRWWGVQWADPVSTDELGAGEARAGTGAVECANHRQGVLYLTISGCSFSHPKGCFPTQLLSWILIWDPRTLSPALARDSSPGGCSGS